ncbi:MAG: phenylalanine 4-monooxygenase [Phycisphaeraceae bacterium]|nr:phenylalanine 4-monooxygenase [Phycisphaeraceae bacterium]MCW5754938.1 phenylalanine 4-monooxygenase [Phycisphaeraceae bacterium]
MRSDINYSKIIDSDEARKAQEAADRAPSLPSVAIDPSKFYITQHFDRYTEENHEVWRTLWQRRMATLEQQASKVFLEGLKAINLTPNHVPKVEDVNARLRPLTGWQSRPVPGYLPAKAFFACLAQRQFPTTITIRPKELMDYLPEPDIFHDIFGHVPLHADPVFSEFLQTYGRAALHADSAYHVERLGRLFWFTVEFGLIREDHRLKLYGSGLISSIGESAHALHSPNVDRRPFDLDRVCETPFEIDHYQPILYVLESFEQLRDAMNSYAQRVLAESNAA